MDMVNEIDIRQWLLCSALLSGIRVLRAGDKVNGLCCR